MGTKFNLLRHLTFAIILLSGIFFNNEAKACHCAGVDMYVTYTGAGIDGCTGTTEYKYDITVMMYSACQTCNLDPGANTTPARVFSVNAGMSLGTAISVPMADVKGVPSTEDTVHSLCPVYNDSNSCKHINDPYFTTRYPGFRRRIYQGSVTVPTAQTDWVFSWTTGGRNASFNMPACNGSIWAEVLINNVTKYNNSSPRFTTNPLPYICVNQPTTYLNGPIDINGDSVQVYQQAPHGGFNAPCNFTTHPITDPIGSAASNPYTLNATTGAATFTPLNTGLFLLGFRAEDYERGTGIKLSHTYRDVQVSILPCTEPPPGIDSLSNSVTVTDGSIVPVIGGSKSVVTCPGNDLNFTLNSRSNDPTHTVYMYANTNFIPGSTFSVTGSGTQNVSGSFKWIPTAADIGEHTLIITSADSTCNAAQPIVLRNYTVVYIKVILGLDAGRDIANCKLNPQNRQLFVKGYGNLDLKVHWTDISGGPAKYLSNPDIKNPISTANENTYYVVSSPDLKNNCKIRDTVLVYVDTSNTIDIFPQANPFVLCRPDYLQLDAIVKGKGPASGLTCGLSAPSTNTLLDSNLVWGSSIYGTGLSYDTLGASTPTLYGNVYSTKYQWLITKEELKEYGFRYSSLKSIAFESAKTGLATHNFSNFTISIKCTKKKVLDGNSGFETGLTTVYTAPGDIQFPDGWHKFDFNTTYNWDEGENLIIEFCWHDNPIISTSCTGPVGLPAVMKYMPTSYIAGLELKPDTNTKDVCSILTSPLIKEVQTRPVFRFTYNESPSVPFVYKWNPGEFLSDSNSKQPLAYIPKTADYSIQTDGRNGCWLRDTIKVIVPVHDFSVWPKDTSICFGEKAPLEIRKGTYYQWFEYENGEYKTAHLSLSCDYCANPIAKPLKTTHYKIKVGDDLFCYDTIDAYIEVRPLPNIKVLNKDTVIKYGQSVQLMVNGARLYNWTPVSSLNNPNISYPIATPSEPTMYVAEGIGTNGCRASDTVRVGLDYRDNLFIPTAFSPNGDGKNDVFKVSNMTFQRFVEFRVFNRWGQEIYNGGGGDPKKGWDGNWKGVAQESGTYQYLIRVASPDGYVETYKGDVTLVR